MAAVLALPTLAAIASAPAAAATSTWSGASSVSWATTGNWTNSTVPGTGDMAVFGAAASNDTGISVGSGVTVKQILFSSAVTGIHTITAGTGSITLDDGGSIVYDRIATGNFNQTISRPIVLSGSATLTNNNTTGNLLILSGSISGSGPIIVSGSGSGGTGGALQVSAANTSFTGSWDVRSGFLDASSSSSALGGSTASVTLNGGILQFGVSDAHNVTANSNSGYFRWSTTNATWSGTLTINSGVLAGFTTGGNSVTWSGVIAGDSTAGFANVASTPVVTLSGSTSNTLSGTYRFNGTTGTYTLDKFNGATAVAGSLLVSPFNGGTVTVKWSQSNQIADTSVVTLSGTSPTSTGTALLQLQGKSDTISGLVSTGSVTSFVQNQTASTTGTLTMNVASGTSYTFAGTLRDGASAGQGVLAIGMAGSGTQVLSGSNTFSGGVTINGGVLQITNANALGTGTATLSAGTLDLGGLSTVANPVVLSGGTLANGTLNVSQLTAASGAVSASLTGGALSKSGAGTLTLSGSNDYSGGLTLSGGVLNMNGSRALGTGTFTITGGTIGNTSGSSVTNANANAQAWNGNFTFAGPADLNLGSGAVSLAADRIVTVNAGTLTIGGSIGGGYGLTKAGAGRLTLGADNGYTGATTITGGTLALAGGGSFATSSRIIVGDGDSSGAVLDLTQKSLLTIGAAQTLQGKGTVLLGTTTALTVAGTFSPGNSPGLFTYASGSTTLGGTTLLEIWGTSRGANPGYDAVNVINGGTLTLGGLLTLDFSQNFADATSFLLVDATAGTLAGAFTSFTVTGAGSDYAGLTFQSVGGNVWETNATGNNQVLRLTETSLSLTLEIVAAVPEPASLALAGIGLAATAWSVARRRRRA